MTVYKKNRIDWITILIPFSIVVTMMAVFMIVPEESKNIVDTMRGFFGDTIGIYYPILAIGSVICALIVAIKPDYSTIKLGDIDKPIYSNFKWGTMIFTSTMAADIMFYSLIEWALYGAEPHLAEMGSMQMWAPTYTLFHWGPLAWGFYVILAVCFGFMMHVRKRECQRFSEACRPLLGDKVDGICGKIIDLIAIFAIICATSTTFSLATPLLTKALGAVFGFEVNTGITICVLLLICFTYTITVLFGVKGMSKLASVCSYFVFLYIVLHPFPWRRNSLHNRNWFSVVG